MKKRIYLQQFPALLLGEEYVDVEENLVRYENDGVSVLRVRAGDPERWFPNWRVIEVCDAPKGTEDDENKASLPMERFAPVTLEDLAADPELHPVTSFPPGFATEALYVVIEHDGR